MNDRIKFMVRFAADDLSKYRPGHWLNLREDLNSFLSRSESVDDFGFVARVNPTVNAFEGLKHQDIEELAKGKPISRHISLEPFELSEDILREVQVGLQTFLKGFAGPAPQTMPGTDSRVFDIDRHSSQLVTLYYDAWKTPGRITVEGSYKDCVLAIAASLLNDPAATQAIKYCPECGGVFLREGKQIFCSRLCTNRAMVKRKRKKDRDEQAAALEKRKSAKVAATKDQRPSRKQRNKSATKGAKQHGRQRSTAKTRR